MHRYLTRAGIVAALSLTVIAAGALAGCGSENSAQDTSEETTATVATSSGQAVSSSNTADSDTGEASSVPTPTFDFSRDLDDDGHWKGVTAGDYVTLCDYSSIEIPSSALDVTEKVQKRMDTIASNAGVDELTDDWVQQNYAQGHGWKTVDDMRAGLTASYQEDAKETYIQDYVVEHSTFSEVPQEILDYTRDYLVYQYTYMASQYNFTLEDLIKMMYGYTSTDELGENNQDTIESQAKMYLAFQAIAEKEGRVADDSELKEHYGDDLDSYEQTYGVGYLKLTVLMDDTLGQIADQATVVDDGGSGDADKAASSEQETSDKTASADADKADDAKTDADSDSGSAADDSADAATAGSASAK